MQETTIHHSSKLKSVMKFFDESSEVKLHDRYFDNFTILRQILIQNGSFISAEQICNW